MTMLTRARRLWERYGGDREPPPPVVQVLIRDVAERDRLNATPPMARIHAENLDATRPLGIDEWERLAAEKPRGILVYRRGISAKQLQFKQLKTATRGFVAGRGAGKTETGADVVLSIARGGEPWIAVSPDSNVVMDTTYPVFQSLAKERRRWIRGVKSPIPRAFFRTNDGGVANIVFKSAERPDKLRGPSKAGLWIDEASVVSHEAFQTVLPVLRWKGKMGPVLMSFTPRGYRHWLFDVFFEPADDDEVELLNEGDDAADVLGDRSLYRQAGGRWFRLRDSAGLVHARSSDNPFLPAEFQDRIGGHLSTMLRLQELGGEFVEIEGLMFRREWLYPLVDSVPRIAARVRFWDRAAGTLRSSCRTAGCLMARTPDGVFWIEDVVVGKWSAEERNRIILETARADAARYGNTVTIYGEQEGGSAGKEISEQFIKMLAGFPVYREVVGGRGTRKVGGQELPGDAKVLRAQGLAAQAEAGNVRMLRAKFTEEALGELAAFPESKYADIVDACSHALNKLSQQWTGDVGPVTRLSRTVDGERFGVHLDRSARTRRG